MRKTATEKVLAWRHLHGVKLMDLAEMIGDPGGQLAKWASGSRQTLPIPLKIRLAQRTGIPLEALLTDNERKLAREIVALIARDAAA